MINFFEDRESAGFLLAKKLETCLPAGRSFAQLPNVLVLGLARGGVIVAKVIATFLEVPLDALVIKKMGSPQNPELAIGAVGPKGTVFWNKELIKQLKIEPAQTLELRRGRDKERNLQETQLRGKKHLEIFGKRVILVDDGVATGASVKAAAAFLKKEKAEKIILAVPVIAEDTIRDIKKYFDTLIYLKKVREFNAVGQFYRNFPQVENNQVIAILNNK